MDYQVILITVLVVLVVVLSIILVRRIKNEKRQMAAIKRMDIADFSDFLLTNSIVGTIGEVAHKVSDLLEESFGCDRVVFLRKRRSFLELSYQHGLGNLNRQPFRISASRNLVKALEENFIPRSIEKLSKVLPEKYLKILQENDLDLFFPVFWRENLYGVYFVRSTIETSSRSFELLIASIAQSLSAAYHVKWHESRSERMQKRFIKSQSSEKPRTSKSVVKRNNMLKLVRHHNAETIIPELIQSIKQDLHINRIAFFYQKNNHENQQPMLVHEGLNCSLSAPGKDCMGSLLKIVNNNTIPIPELAEKEPSLRNWTQLLGKAGLDKIASFSFSEDYRGVLALDGTSSEALLNEQLQEAKSNANDLIHNAKSFKHIEEMSYTDELTGLANQRYFRRRLNEEIQRAQRYDRKLAFIIFDIDELKITNDTFGHLAGDAVLKQMGTILRKSIRAIDIIARYGGDEFCVVMPETNAVKCTRFMSRLKGEVARASFVVPDTKERLTCTVSLGGATYPDHANNSKQLIYLADMALLQAKSSGRNKFLLYKGDMLSSSR
ncbi:MAG: GGDEF domain-containing protein [candidate division Zixibacteria bacterium]|nr:GGDEF domain-containing protein [candidate division Zixibacteria bacterium]